MPPCEHPIPGVARAVPGAVVTLVGTGGRDLSDRMPHLLDSARRPIR
ncbi:hypothetical protein STRTUCAR8_09054 [Streptomyces turgidiscabies Car8]|uniref:Uncharacterized protein n=1 Tax=Streptomyces turgidiscabies (strain Car8) TaxID=698760 RepID=L7FGC6_STRT8|nr:hypothetical protein STRTUCAR8_09054 [Streptomyces turgidiscabies Car8]